MTFGIINGILTPIAAEASSAYAPFSFEAWEYAGQMTLLGMVMVFSVLCALWGVLGIFKLVFARDEKPKKKKSLVTGVEHVETAESSASPAPAARQDDGELVAVLTAAVAAYMAAEQGVDANDVGAFRVVSFKRVSAGRAWNSK